ncbi:MAG: ABC transporter ATP-binding protein [Bacteroidales bacterium]|nr:ABC transporter ATP-binding protein [Bacteroidales bacterium]
MVNINQLNFGYKKKKTLFSELNLELKEGRIYGLLGKNGSGKTTLLKQVAGILHPQSGTVKLNDETPQKRTPQVLASYYMIPEEFETPGINVKTYLKVTAPFYPNFNETKFYEYLKEFDINTEQRLSKMSYGQKKKFLISFGMAADTPVLITDEPTNGLDIPSKSIFRKLMASALSEDKLFVISTHQVKDIEGIIDTIVVLDDGKIIFNQSLETVSEKLCFKTVKNIDDENVLYAEKGLTGYTAVVRNTGEEPSHINTELLFNSIITKNSKVVSEFT